MEERLLLTLAQTIAAICVKWLCGFIRTTLQDRTTALTEARKAYREDLARYPGIVGRLGPDEYITTWLTNRGHLPRPASRKIRT